VFFAACGALCLYSGRLIGWLAIAFSVVSLSLLVWMAFSPHSRLRLSQEGFSFGTLRGLSSYRWSDVERFFTSRFANSHHVGFLLRRFVSVELCVPEDKPGNEAAFSSSYSPLPPCLPGQIARWLGGPGNAGVRSWLRSIGN
jgi:hypothetical protein